MSAAARRYLAIRALAALIFVAIAGPAMAIQDCSDARKPIPGADDEPVYKLVLDEVQVLGDLDEGILGRMLSTRLHANVEKILLAFNKTRTSDNDDDNEIHVIICPGRAPLNVSDISNEIEGFTEHNVVLEIWGVFDGDEAVFTNALVPLLSVRAQGWDPGAQFFEDSFLYDRQGSTLRFLKDVMSDSLRMRSYAAVGIASRALMLGKYDDARFFFCHASLLLDDVASRAEPDREDRLLADFAARMALETVALAVDDPAYQGSLGTPNIPVGQGCPGPVA